MVVILCSLSDREDVIGLEKSNSLAILKSITRKDHKGLRTKNAKKEISAFLLCVLCLFFVCFAVKRFYLIISKLSRIKINI